MMKITAKIGAFMLLLMTLACASNKNSATPEEIAALDDMIENRNFEIQALWALPMPSQGMNSIANAGLLPFGSTANRIDITTTGGYLRIVGDTVKANLPYFGERQMGGMYNQNKAGIQFDGVPKELSFSSNKRETGKIMQFTINDDLENYQVYAQLFPNGNALLTISSSHRRNIGYQGNVSKYEKKE